LASIQGVKVDSTKEGVDFGSEADYRQFAASQSPWGIGEEPPAQDNKCTMFYDGGCPLCSKEVKFYKDLDTKAAVNWIDISSTHTAPAELESRGINLDKAMARLHVLDGNNMREGASAFVALWKNLPYFSLLVPLFKVPGVLEIAEAGYTFFAKRRLAFRQKR
jgi:predicted DCC family thiol-disulfide oxidoreductase YuxK